ncbi:cupin-like domain-containing protein [Stakelama marina]|uniref:Cupin-like domain-containing protein n=1 Tax=Stakelama marina TaxID=2826939 RepID=A0A8T4ID80_9SPHN|nr:cupin-like domain-containing protein [Stakelama marina]MBR0552530.1 cupin-like domain-containing protein [Stakelama marina]
MIPIEEIHGISPAQFDAEVASGYRPVVLRGLADGWPLVEAGRESARAALDHLARFDSGRPADVMIAPPGENGRFFYRGDMRGFNFSVEKQPLGRLGTQLLDEAANDAAPARYAGATDTAEHLPGFDDANPLPLAQDKSGAQSRVWLASRSQVATHYDLSDNVAVVALGRRRFTLFPPEATADLYVGPLNITIAGQPVSMADPLNPDLERYPRFAAALDKAMTVELEPGDAIYIPTLWWHHVAALDPVNILVNYWYNHAPHGGPFIAFVHALSAVRDLPQAERDAWRHWFEHFIFSPDADHAADHLPLHARGVQGPPSPQRSEAIRAFVARALSGR